MPEIDVTEVLTDPDFAERLQRDRMIERVGSNGVATEAPVRSRFIGVVVAQRQTIQRGADAETVSGSIQIITREPLRDGKQGESADIVTWRDRRYTVTDVADYANFGRGFVRATCELLPFTG